MMTSEEIKQKLDSLYWSDAYKYRNFLEHVKNSGYKAMRNSKGEHRVTDSIVGFFSEILGGKI